MKKKVMVGDLLLNKYSMTLIKVAILIVIRTTAMGFYSGGERWGSTPNIAWASENLQGRGQWIENYSKKTIGLRGVLATLTLQDSC